MPPRRIADAPIEMTGRGAPVVDLVAPPLDEVDDALSALTPKVAPEGRSDLTAVQRAMLVGHERMKRRKSEAEAVAKALRPDIAAALAAILR